MLWVGLVALGMTACHSGSRQGAETPTGLALDSLDFATLVEVKHAEGFSVSNYPTHKELLVHSPGTRDTLGYYILHPRGSAKPKVEHPKAVFIPVPALRIACSTSSEIGALPPLGLQERLVAIHNPEYVNDSTLIARIASGDIVSIGQGMGRDVERLIGLRPEIYLQDLYSASDKDEDIIASGINIVYYMSWKEQSLLGRAEWLKVMGLLLGHNQRAREHFDGVEARYREARELVGAVEELTPILYGRDFKGVWYLPGEYSYVSRMFADAKISYDYAEGELDSRPTSFEYIFGKHRHKAIWLCSMIGKLTSLQDFLSLNERYSHFEAAKSGQVWVDRKRINAHGASDYWESGPYHPDLLLKDLIKIAHPELLPSYETTYWLQLQR